MQKTMVGKIGYMMIAYQEQQDKTKKYMEYK